MSPHIKVSCMPQMLSLITEELSCAFYLFFHISPFSGITELHINLNGSEHNVNTEWDRIKMRRNIDHGSARYGNDERMWHPELQENLPPVGPGTGTFWNLPRPHIFMVISVNLVFNPARGSFRSLGPFRVGWGQIRKSADWDQLGNPVKTHL